MAEMPQSFFEKLQSLGVIETPRVMIVSVKDQKLTLFEAGEIKDEYPVSTARNGTGQKLDSYQTPLGLHRIKQKIGREQSSGAIFESRVFYGQIWIPSPHLTEKSEPPVQGKSRSGESMPPVSDLVTSRILWLEGLEPGFNTGNDKEGHVVDSYQRYIYIHGTNHEDEIGKPASRGCIRMKNTEVIRLFDQVQEDDLIWIQE